MTNKGDSNDFFSRYAHLMGANEISTLKKFGLGRRIGFGFRPALIIVDLQKYMVPPEDVSMSDQYPAACASGTNALPVIARVAAAFREAAAPVIYTRNLLRRDGADRGLKRFPNKLIDLEGWFVEGTRGAEFVEAVAPLPRDIVITKPKPSAFHGTPLLGLLIDRQIDTVVITGGATSNCVRATSVDAAAYNFRPIVIRDGVFDRVNISHEVGLMDIDRQMGDVVDSGEVIDYLSKLEAEQRSGAQITR